ncbi:helix-turn-helix transcriptional regulator [Fodinibius halophilus]|uniref:Transcriptional regulator n=1 Tax=Fodinibius halophilus TaxID=1736908 RepID=A0A6M1T6Y0_9BACT|nr:metalloregulator ArsR/SmtB family transcription factor [Fodinibius halophilus]NGP87781.1 transcriptional regulator [Fodinibius halophilus]
MKNSLPDHERAVWYLKTEGAKTVKALANSMDITVEGARFHLMKLEKEGLVKSESVAEGRGRPKQLWSLTQKGHNRFPNAHADLTVDLIDMMRQTLGQEALDQVIAANESRTLERYQEELEGVEEVEKRVKKLAEIRSNEGYMAEYEESGDGFLLVENHCPICDAAEVCQGFCRAELSIFREVLGEDVEVNREEHIIKGARRCAYKISVLD